MLHDKIVPQVSQEVKDALKRINAVGERNRREYEALARMTGRTVAEVEADLTAPDPGLEEDECSLEWCHEEEFRRGLCFQHFVEEETAAWHDRDAVRRTCLEGVGYVFGDPLLEEVMA